MGTLLGPKYIPYTYMDPLGLKRGASEQLLDEVIRDPKPYMSYSLNSLKGGYIRDY